MEAHEYVVVVLDAWQKCSLEILFTAVVENLGVIEAGAPDIEEDLGAFLIHHREI